MENQWTVKSVDGVDLEDTKQEEATPVAEEQQEAFAEQDDNVLKVNLDEPPKQEEPKTEEKDEQQVSDESESKQDEQLPEAESAEEPESPLELISEEEPKEESVEEKAEPVVEATAEQVDAIQEAAADPAIELPENIQKLVDFMNETGGTVEDYVNLNKDLTDYSDEALLQEYYRQSKPSWDQQDINDHMADHFGYDEELDEARDVRAKKRAFKDELYNAKKFLEGNREKYYADLVSKKQTNIPQDYQEAFSFYSEYKESQKSSEQLQSTFKQKTEQVFNDDFKGFDFNIGDSKYRYKVNEPGKVKEYQSDINNFVKEFLQEDGTIGDAAGYHKAMFAAKNVDKIAQHFYEQGRAEALKQSAAEAKNINMDPRKDASAEVVTKSGTKVRVVDSGSGSRLRFKNYKNR